MSNFQLGHTPNRNPVISKYWNLAFNTTDITYHYSVKDISKAASDENQRKRVGRTTFIIADARAIAITADAVG
jgi:hypothetical protein